MTRSRTLRKPGGFFAGIIIGAVLTYCLFFIGSFNLPVSSKNLSSEQVVLQSRSLSRVAEEDEISPSEEVTWPVPKGIRRKSVDDTVASSLTRKVRILCCVMTAPDRLASNAVHIKATWGRRCNILLFMSSKPREPVPNNLSLPIVELDFSDGRTSFWEKTKAALKYIYKQRYRDADWVFIADDNTFAVVENLRYLLKDQTPLVPVYLGRRFKSKADGSYMSGGAGYVLSRAAVRKFVTSVIQNPGLCPDSKGIVEDVLLGACLETCGVKSMDTRDDLGRQRFHPLWPWDLLVAGRLQEDFWLFSSDYYPTKLGRECCSDYTVTFLSISPQLMHVMDFLVYHMRPYGIAKNCDLLEDI